MILFSNYLTEALTYFDESPQRAFTSDTLVTNIGFWSYTFFEGEIPTDEWFDQFLPNTIGSVDARALRLNYASQEGCKEVASIVFNSAIHRSEVLPSRRSVSASSSTSYLNRMAFVEDGTPNWFMLCQYIGNVSDNNIGSSAVSVIMGKIGVNEDLYITKSPITQYSEITLSDISLDHRTKDLVN